MLKSFNILAITAVVCLLLPTCVSTKFGVNIHFTTPQPGEVKMIADAGWEMVRMDFMWSNIETTPGNYDFSQYDTLLSSLAEFQIVPIFIIDYGNTLYSNTSITAPLQEPARTAFTNFVIASLKHFGDVEIYWEFWNEPDLNIFWAPQPNATAYCELFVPVLDEIRAIVPNATVIAAALSNMLNWDYWQNITDCGLMARVDYVSTHGYKNKVPEDWVDNHKTLQNLLTASNVSTEIGNSEWGKSMIHVTEHQQAQFLVREYLATISTGAPFSIWYDWHNDCQDNSTNNECLYGTVHFQYFNESYPYRPKYAYNAAKTFMLMLKQNQLAFSGEVQLEGIPATGRVYQFSNSTNSIYVCWAKTWITRLVQFKATPQTCFKELDMFGVDTGKQYCSSSSGFITVSVTEAPVYLVPMT